jgi:hypothetical protein
MQPVRAMKSLANKQNGVTEQHVLLNEQFRFSSHDFACWDTATAVLLLHISTAFWGYNFLY